MRLSGQKPKRPEDYGTNQIWLFHGNDEEGTTGVTMRDGTTFVWDKKQKKLVEGSPPEPAIKFYDPHPPTPK